MTTKTRDDSTRPGNQPGFAVGATVGLLTAAAGLGAAELAAGALRTASPVIVVGDALVDNSPPELMALAISLLGTADKPVLLAGIVLVLAVSGAVLGTVALRRPLLGQAGLVVLAAAGATAVLLRRADDPGAVVPVLVGAVAGAAALALLMRSAGNGFSTGEEGETTVPAARGEADHPPRGPGRRGFVRTATGVLGASAAAGAVGHWLPRFPGSSTDAALKLPAPARPLPPLPAGVDLGVPGLTPFTTPNTDFYRIDTALSVPRPDPSRWTLRVHGMVDRPFEIDMDELLSMPLEEADITLTCVSNQVGGDLAGNTRWLGVRLDRLLRRAGVHPGADQILSTSDDGWTCGTPTEVVMDGRDALLAVGMGGEPLPAEHGYPARMVVPGLYGFVSATKWVTDIKLTRFADERAYWARRGWGVRAPIKTMSRVDVPAPLSRVASGDVVLAGVAWAQHRGVDAVEVRLDGGDWWEAELARVPGIDTWVQWVTETSVAPGLHAVEVRATDAIGATQPSARAEPIPDGATGWHRIRFTAE
ncbi:molybdopterin-dependent oxidoreductase [Nocardiopsis sp. FIRDI 009]|uniref:molybdopterin-dependent oxidoreductase n=1 Tax=Nocardiopsis sp. FIRDI 009 TaxID=714197 RepID=UPI00351502EC